jgi:curved DNA-binding protein CbpA
MTPLLDPYAVLELTPTASAGDIKQAYFRLVRAYPPDREPEKFKQIRAAYDQLKTPEKRQEADMLRLADWPEPELPPAAPLDFTVAAEDVIRAARAFSDLAHTDWHDDFREVRL